MKHEEMFKDALLKRIPMAPIIMAINLAMVHVPEEYVVAHLSFKTLNKWSLTGKRGKLLVMHPTLQGEVERARIKFLQWQDANKDRLPNTDDPKKKSAKQKKTDEKIEMGPLYAYMTVRALEGAVNIACGSEDAAEVVDILECLGDVPSEAGAEEKVESLTDVLQSLDDLFDSHHWKSIVGNAA